jgi:hypothetical protein
MMDEGTISESSVVRAAGRLFDMVKLVRFWV